MALTAMEVFERTVYDTSQELIKENVEVFNSHSKGAIVLGTKSIVGDFEQSMNLVLGQDLIKSRNPYSNDTLTAKGFSRVKDNAVKMGLGIYPIEWTYAEFNWVKQNPELAGVKIGRAVADQTTKYMAEVAIGALATCLNSNTKVKTTVGTGSTLSHLDLIKAVRPMGDQYNSIELFVMHSSQYFDLVETTFNNAENLFDFGGITIMRNALGQTFLITDNKALVHNKDTYTLGLKKNSVFVGYEEDFVSEIEPLTGKENLGKRFQAEWTSTLKVSNYRYKTSDQMNGLSYSLITQASNWERISDKEKDETGVIIVETKA
ncbi:TPA: major capsid protein [Haemophilus influenzae]